MAVTLRPITPEDEPFLLQVYGDAREAELAQVPWDEDQKKAFLAFQFNAQHQHYQTEFPNAAFSVILHAGTPVGRFYVDRRLDEIRILDIALIVKHQGRGLSKGLLQDLLAEASAAHLPVRIFVEQYQHRAQALFQSLGFTPIQDHGVSVLMEWRPGEG